MKEASGKRTESETEKLRSEADWSRFNLEHQSWRKSVAADFNDQTNILIEKAWAAGFFDGEGHTSSRVSINYAGPSPVMTFEIDQGYGERGLANLQRFRRAVDGAGSISRLRRRDSRGEAMHRWRGSSEEDLKRVWAAIGPFLGLQKFADFRMTLLVPALRESHSDLLGRKRRHRSNIRSVDL